MKKLLFTLCCVLFTSIAFCNHWTPITGNYSTMTVYGVIVIDGVEQTSTTLELGAFCENECRGSAYATYFPPYQKYMVSLTIKGVEEVGGAHNGEITFKLYDAEHQVELDLDCLNTITYQADVIIGQGGVANLFQFAFATPATTYTLDIPGYGAGNTGGYHLIASPVTEEITPSTENGFISSKFDLYYFNQNGDDDGNEWINYELEGGGYANWTISSGKGYLYASQEDTQLKFTGTPYSGDGSITLAYSEDNQDSDMWGWNLIGNPFPNDADVDRGYYVMNEDGNELITDNSTIAPMEGIFVKATENGETVTFIPNSGPNPSAAKIVVNVLKDRGVAIDRAIVRFDNSSTLPKFMLNPDNTKVYIPQGGEDYAVVNSNIENSMPVNFKASEDGIYTLKIEVNDVRMEYLHLIDNKTGADVDLLVQPDYQFSATNHDYESRFTLVFKAMTGVDENGASTSSTTFCFVNGRSLYFCEDVEGADFSLVDMTGRTLCNKVLKGNGVDLSSLSQGVYVVRLANGNEVKVQKVVVR